MLLDSEVTELMKKIQRDVTLSGLGKSVYRLGSTTEGSAFDSQQKQGIPLLDSVRISSRAHGYWGIFHRGLNSKGQS